MSENFIGREPEMNKLKQFTRSALGGKGKLVLIAGEAGIGKSRLVEECLEQSNIFVLRGSSSQEGTPPYGPIVEALRFYLRAEPDRAADWGPLAAHLAVLLAELGVSPANTDGATLFEAIRAAFGAIARTRPIAVFLDDLQWTDSTTLEMCSRLAGWVQQEPILIIGVYRSDEIPRGHPIRRLRTELRRSGRHYEISVAPFTLTETAALAASILGEQPTPKLAAKLYNITQGFPLFIEELSSAMIDSEHLRKTTAGIDLNVGDEIPIPDTLKDIILQRAADSFDASGLYGDAAAERIAAAQHLEHAGRFHMALEMVTTSAAKAAEEGRMDLQILALGLEGQIRAEMGNINEGLSLIKSGLELALDHNISGLAAYAYYKLATVFDISSDYTTARDTYTTAIDFCHRNGLSEMEQVCMACFTVVLRQTGEWDRATALCREVLASPEIPPPIHAIALGMLGSIQAFTGMGTRTRGLLLEAHALAQQNKIVALEMDTNWNLAILDDLEGAYELAAERCQSIIALWATFFATHNYGVMLVLVPMRWLQSRLLQEIQRLWLG